MSELAGLALVAGFILLLVLALVVVIRVNQTGATTNLRSEGRHLRSDRAWRSEARRSVADLQAFQFALVLAVAIAISAVLDWFLVVTAALAWILAVGIFADFRQMRTELIEWRQTIEFDTTTRQTCVEVLALACGITAWAALRLAL